MIKSMSIKFNGLLPTIIKEQSSALSNSIVSALLFSGRARLMSNSYFDLYDYIFSENSFDSNLNQIIKEAISNFIFERFNINVINVLIVIDQENREKKITLEYAEKDDYISINIIKKINPTLTNQNKKDIF